MITDEGLAPSPITIYSGMTDEQPGHCGSLYAARDAAGLSLKDASALATIPFETLEALEVGVGELDLFDATKPVAIDGVSLDNLMADNEPTKRT